MLAVVILGASGYSGQEVLDRVLRHPELQVAALGSDSLAGRSAAALDVRLNGFPSGVLAERGGITRCRRRRRLPLSSATNARRASCRRKRRWSSISPVSTGLKIQSWPCGTIPLRSGAWSYGLPEHSVSAGGQPGSLRIRAVGLRDGGAPRPRPTRPDVLDPASVVVDAKSGVSGAGRELKASSHAGFVLENVSPYCVGRHRHAAELAQALGYPVCFTPHLLPVRRGLLATCYARVDGDARELLEASVRGQCARARAAPKVSFPSSRAVQHTDDAEIGVFDDVETRAHRRRLRARQPREGRCRPGASEREHGARARGDGRAAPERSARMSVTTPAGFVASGVHAGLRKNEQRDLALVRSLVPAVGAGMFTTNRVQAAPGDHLPRAPRSRRAAGGRGQLRSGERCHRRTGCDRGSARQPPKSPWLLGLQPEQVWRSPLDRR